MAQQPHEEFWFEDPEARARDTAARKVIAGRLVADFQAGMRDFLNATNIGDKRASELSAEAARLAEKGLMLNSRITDIENELAALGNRAERLRAAHYPECATLSELFDQAAQDMPVMIATLQGRMFSLAKERERIQAKLQTFSMNQ